MGSRFDWGSDAACSRGLTRPAPELPSPHVGSHYNVTRYQGNLRVTRVTGHVARQYFPTTLASVPGEVDIPGTHGRASGSGQAEPVTLAPSRLLLQSSDTAYLYNNNYTIITGRHRHTSKRRSHTRANHQLSRGARGAQPPTHLLNMC